MAQSPTPATPPRATGMVTFLFTDIEGSVRLWEQHSPAMHAALAQHDALLRQVIESHHGQVFKTVGDAFYAAFAVPREAVEAAVAAQRGLQQELPQIRVRMAVHTGEAEAREGDYFGPTVNRVARLLAAGHGGQVLLSGTTAEVLRTSLPPGSGLRPLGEHRLRDLPYREAIFQLLHPELESDFPPLNTLDVAFRRGVRRTAAVSAAILAAMGGLALTALNQAHRADQQRRVAEQLRHLGEERLYVTDMNVAQQAWEAGNIQRAAALLERHRPGKGQADLRGFEWRYLWRRCQGDQRFTFRGRNDGVNTVGFSPDGKLLAAGGDDNTVKLYDVASHREVGSFKIQRGGINGLAFSPDGRMIATSGGDSMVRLWEVASRRELATLAGHKKGVGAVAFSPDGKLLASAGGDNTVRLWDLASRRTVATLPGHKHSWIQSMALSPDGKTVAVGQSDGTVGLWDAATGRERASFHERPRTIVFSVAFSPDGDTLAAGDWDSTVTLWSVTTKREVATLKGHRSQVQSVAFSPDGKLLASGSADTTVKLWKIGTAQEPVTLRGHTGGVISVVFSPDGRTLATGSADQTAKLWDVGASPQVETLKGHTRDVRCAAFSPDGKILATGSEDRTVRLWSVASGRTMHTFRGFARRLTSLAFSPNGQFLATGTGEWDDTGPSEVKLWDVDRRQLLARFRGHKGAVFALAFSPDSKMLASGSFDKTVRLWDIPGTGPHRPPLRGGAPPSAPPARREAGTLRGHKGGVWAVTFSPDGRTLVSTSWDWSIKLWDVATKTEIGTLKGHKMGVLGCALSPDGKILATGSFDSTVKLWDMAARRPLFTLEGMRGAVAAVAFSPDGKTLASNHQGGTVTLWSLKQHEPVLTLRGGHEIGGLSVPFSPDNTLLAAAGQDHTVLLWRAATFQESDPLQVVATGGDRTVQLQWPPLPHALAYNVYRGSEGVTGRQFVRLATQPVTEPSFTDRSPLLVNGRPQTYRVAAVYPSASGQATEGPLVTLQAIPVAAPPGFMGSSINEGNQCGSVLFQPGRGQITLRGTGQGVWGQADGFYFLNQPVTGDFQVIVPALTRPTLTHERALAGLMVRESLEAGGRHVCLVTSATQGLQSKWRASTGADVDVADLIPDAALKLPIILRLFRHGRTITAEYSRDNGHSFQPAGAPYRFDEPLPETVYAGLAITSHDPSQVAEAKFSGLEIRGR